MSLGKKAGLKSPGVAWINPIVSIFEISGMHWWPWPVMVFGTLIGISLMFVFQTFASILISAVLLTFLVMIVIWHWKTFEAVNRPGWWALVSPIMFLLGLGMLFVSAMVGFILFILAALTYFVFIGVAAWGNANSPTPTTSTQEN